MSKKTFGTTSKGVEASLYEISNGGGLRVLLKNGFPGDFFHRERSVFLGMACRCPLRSVFRRLFRRTDAGGDSVPDGAFL